MWGSDGAACKIHSLQPPAKAKTAATSLGPRLPSPGRSIWSDEDHMQTTNRGAASAAMRPNGIKGKVRGAALFFSASVPFNGVPSLRRRKRGPTVSPSTSYWGGRDAPSEANAGFPNARFLICGGQQSQSIHQGTTTRVCLHTFVACFVLLWVSPLHTPFIFCSVYSRRRQDVPIHTRDT